MDAGYLFAALVWGSVGLGFTIYGKKQQAIIPLIGGILLIGLTYIIRTGMMLSLVSIVIIAAIIGLKNLV